MGGIIRMGEGAGGTSIDWRASLGAKYPGTAWFWRLFMTAVLRKVATDLAAAAERPPLKSH